MSTPSKHLPVAGSVRAPLEGAREIGPANPSETVDVTIRLRPRSPIKLTEQRSIVSRKEFEQRHGADPKSIALVESFARAHKLLVKEESPARRTVILSGPVAAMNEAFGVELKEYEHPSGKYRGRAGASRRAAVRFDRRRAPESALRTQSVQRRAARARADRVRRWKRHHHGLVGALGHHHHRERP